MELIDSLKFAREKKRLHGSLPVSGFERLRDSLYAAPGSDDCVEYSAVGSVDARERPIIGLTIAGQLALRCQRCLGEYVYELAIDNTLRLVQEALLDAEQSDDPDEADCIAADEQLDLAALIEDEILLALPPFPRHATQRCGSAVSEAEVNKISAFSVLDQLARRGKQ